MPSSTDLLLAELLSAVVKLTAEVRLIREDLRLDWASAVLSRTIDADG